MPVDSINFPVLSQKSNPEILNSILDAHHLVGVDRHQEYLGESKALSPPQWVFESPLYEIFLRAFSKKGDFSAVENSLSYLIDLGIKTIWLMPIHPVGNKGRKGSLGSPYSISDFFAVDPAYGTKKELQSLVKAAHQNSMRLILDFVGNHSSNDHILMAKNPEMFLRDADGKFTRKHKAWTDITDFNFNEDKTWDYLLEAMKYWVVETDIDGYRCDSAGMVQLDFWQEALQQLQKLKNDIFLLAEWEGNTLHQNAFHMTYDWTTYLLLGDVYAGKRPANELFRYLGEKHLFYPQNAAFLRFTENHDIPRTRKKFGVKTFWPFVTFLFCIEGVPLIYSGQEIGMQNTPSLFENEILNWQEADEGILRRYKKLIQLRQEYPALRSGNEVLIETKDNIEFLAMIKTNGHENILALFNFSGEIIRPELCLPDSVNYKSFFDLINENNLTEEALENLTMQPYSAQLISVDL